MNLTFYFCDRKKCEHCFEKCLHTADPEHALSKTEWQYTKDPWGNFVQVFTGTYDHETVEALNDSTEAIDKTRELLKKRREEAKDGKI